MTINIKILTHTIAYPDELIVTFDIITNCEIDKENEFLLFAHLYRSHS